jgi:hypothetical protein
MIYMVATLPGPGSGRAAMAGMAGRPVGGSLVGAAMVLAIGMVGYVLWSADQLTSLARTASGAASSGAASSGAASSGAASSGAASSGAASSGAARSRADAAGAVAAETAPGVLSSREARPARGAALAPVLGACARIAMGATMGYMLLATL